MVKFKNNLIKKMFITFFSANMHSFCLDHYLDDFDIQMNFKKVKYKKKYSDPCMAQSLLELKKLYEQNHFSKIFRSSEPKIPKIIHQIWIGPKPLPEIVKSFAKTWQLLNPSFAYILWTNDSIYEVLSDMTIEHRELYESVDSFQAKADLLRYYILYKYGGLYVDADIKCLDSFEDLHHYYDFYVGITCNNSYKGELINNALIATAPGHLIMKSVIDMIKKDSADHWLKIFGVTYFSDLVHRIIIEAPGVNIALPMNVFYPLDGVRGIVKKEYPSSMSVHFWSGGSNPNWEMKDYAK